MAARIRSLRTRVRHARMRISRSPLGRAVLHHARDPEIRQGAKDVAWLGALYLGAKHLPRLQRKFHLLRQRKGQWNAADMLAGSYGVLPKGKTKSLLRRGIRALSR